MYIANDENKFEVDQIYTGRFKIIIPHTDKTYIFKLCLKLYLPIFLHYFWYIKSLKFQIFLFKTVEKRRLRCFIFTFDLSFFIFQSISIFFSKMKISFNIFLIKHLLTSLKLIDMFLILAQTFEGISKEKKILRFQKLKKAV